MMKVLIVAVALTFTSPAFAGSSDNIEKIMEKCQNQDTGVVNRACVQREMKTQPLTTEEKQILDDVKKEPDVEDVKRQAARKAEGDLCNTFPSSSKMYRQCWCNSSLSGSWRHRICK
jgi:hypothetical protein